MRMRLLAALVVFALGCGGEHELVAIPTGDGDVDSGPGGGGDPDANPAPDPRPKGPYLVVSAERLDFGRLAPKQVRTRALTVSNGGTEDLVISAFQLTGAPGFRFGFRGADEWEYRSPLELEEQFPIPIALAPGASWEFEVRYGWPEVTHVTGHLSFVTNEVVKHAGVPLLANPPRPCLEVHPPDLQFGARPVGERAALPVTLRSCGEKPLQVSSITLADGDTGNFSLELGELTPPSGAAPLTIAPGETATFEVVYRPTAVTPLVDGQLKLDEATLVVSSSSADGDEELRATGVGSAAPVANASAVLAEKRQVIPQTLLHFDARDSFGPKPITKFEWRVEQPKGSASVFLPNAFAESPTFEANVAGEYLFSLHVWDEGQQKSLVPWTASVFVIPIDEIHVELLWHTPNDPDETDEGAETGSDADLHFAHEKYAVGSGFDGDKDGIDDPWFNQPYDTFWFNPQPNWGTFNPAVNDDPRLDRDDTDGAGPENLNLMAPVSGTRYRVGVHYWSDHSFGDAYATVRFYIAGVMVAEMPEVRLSNMDMWCVATIDWPSAKVTPCTNAAGQLWITPVYQNPYFIPTN